MFGSNKERRNLFNGLKAQYNRSTVLQDLIAALQPTTRCDAARLRGKQRRKPDAHWLGKSPRRKREQLADEVRRLRAAALPLAASFRGQLTPSFLFIPRYEEAFPQLH